jgi:hypothetical protein
VAPGELAAGKGGGGVVFSPAVAGGQLVPHGGVGGGGRALSLNFFSSTRSIWNSVSLKSFFIEHYYPLPPPPRKINGFLFVTFTRKYGPTSPIQLPTFQYCMFSCYGYNEGALFT